MPIEFNQLFSSFLHVMFILAGILYSIFAVIVIRQISSMQKSLMTSVSGRLKLLGYVHLIIAVAILLFFIVSL